MSDDEGSLLDFFLDKIDEGTLRLLKSAGLTDEQIDAIDDEDEDDPNRSKEFNSTVDAHLQAYYVRNQIKKHGPKTAQWIEDGAILILNYLMATVSEREETTLNDWRSEIARRPRHRNNVAKRAIEYILREAPEYPGTPPGGSEHKQLRLDASRKHTTQERGRDIARFRHFVGTDRRLHGKTIDIEITMIDDDYGNVSYEFFDNLTDERNVLKEVSVRSIIHRLDKK